MRQDGNPEAARDKLAEAYSSGEMSTLAVDQSVIDAPQPFYAAQLEQHAVVANNGQLSFLRHADCVELMRDEAIVQPGSGLLMGSPRPLIPLDLDGPEHTKYRKLLDPMFAPKKVAELEGQVRDLANELIDTFADRGEVEAYEAFCVPLPTQIFIAMMGLPQSDLPKFLDWKDRTIKPELKEDPAEMLAGIQAAGAEMSTYIRSVVEERIERHDHGDDLLSGLLHAEVDGEGLSLEQLTDIVYLFMIAGLDTVTSALSLMFARLAAHTELRRRLVDEPQVIPNAVEELMRYEAPVGSSNRLATKDIEIAGHEVPAGSYVQANWQAANLDPAVFENPLAVDFDRTRIKHTSFASGPHRCMGSHLARLEMRCALEEWHRRIPEYSIAAGEKPEFTYGGVRAASVLPLEFPVPA